ncbi:MAG TPA: acyltransferase domain-containing protein [Edaphobacter sp.]|nr:acyltransferase domain-containing protein [Edaphobacter sp.]
MRVFMFPGQGSQQRGMGRESFDRVKQFTSIEQEIDEVLGFSVRTLCLENPANQLSQTQFTQPALYVTNALHYFAKVDQSGPPD